MKAADQHITLSSGEKTTLHALCEAGPVALVFLRHFGCIFCREAVAEYRENPDWNVVFVSMGSVEASEEFRNFVASPHRFICDPQAELYAAFGLKRGNSKQLFGPAVWKAGAQAWGKGHRVGRPVGDPFQMSGTFILRPGGEVVYEHIDEHAGDIALAEEVGGILRTHGMPEAPVFQS